MGLILDIVPNHMAASVENPWWFDVLEKGQGSPYAAFFDVNWESKRVLLPILSSSLAAHTKAVLIIVLDAGVLEISIAGQGENGQLDRSVLPIPEPNIPHSTTFDARDATPPPRFEAKAPAGAPNILIILIDDMGFRVPIFPLLI